MMDNFGFNSQELSILKRLNTPAKIQDFLEYDISYNLEEKGETYYSPKLVLRYKKAHCLEGALLAAATLRLHGHSPLLLDLQAVRDDDHVLAVYKRKNQWGAIAQSKFSGLRFRDAVYSSIRELVMSYFESYFNYNCEKTLRRYSIPINLSRFDKKNWMTSEASVEHIAESIHSVRHYNIFSKAMTKSLRKVDNYRLDAELIVRPKNMKTRS